MIKKNTRKLVLFKLTTDTVSFMDESVQSLVKYVDVREWFGYIINYFTRIISLLTILIFCVGGEGSSIKMNSRDYVTHMSLEEIIYSNEILVSSSQEFVYWSTECVWCNVWRIAMTGFSEESSMWTWLRIIDIVLYW